MNVWKCKPIFPTGTVQQNIQITDLNPFLAGENTSVLIIVLLERPPLYFMHKYYK